MDLNELLSYKPQRKGGEKRSLEEGYSDVAPPPKAPKQKLSSEKLSRTMPNPLAPPPVRGSSATEEDVNGISDEEKLKLLLSMEDEEEDVGEQLSILDSYLARGQANLVHKKGVVFFFFFKF